MDRRGFLELVGAAVNVLTLGLVGTEKKEEGHIFDWTTNPPHTTDPRYPELYCGLHNHTFLNGKELVLRRMYKGGTRQRIVGGVRRFKTGKRGWVECIVQDSNGDYVIVDGRILTRILTGHVEYYCATTGNYGTQAKGDVVSRYSRRVRGRHCGRCQSRRVEGAVAVRQSRSG